MATTGQNLPRDPFTDARAMRVLSTIYRARPASIPELAAFEAVRSDDLPALVSRLADHGLLLLDGERITPVSPDHVVAALTGDVTSRHRDELAQLGEHAARLSVLSRDWELGLSDDSASPWAEVVHGHEAQWHAWGRYAATHPPRSPLNLYPDLSVLKTIVLPSMTEEQLALVAAHLRAVFPASVLASDEGRRMLDRLVTAGAGIRLIESVPSWLYADAGVLCAVPLVWGEHPPTSIVIVHQPAIVEVVSLLAESFWERGADYPEPAQGWRPVLRLLARGMPDATIAETLDLSLRTVQRRITEAMDHYHVRSRFELGVAWGSDPAAS